MRVAVRIVPAVADLDAAGRSRFVAIVSKALAERPRPIQHQFGLFLGVLRWAPFLRFGSPFDRLPPEDEDTVLRWFLDAPVAKLRSGFWALRALAFMGYYGQPEVWPSLRYTPSFRGNEMLHG
ncbi:MAG: hypothetical protein A2Y78_16415 [Acidobacteria bacterium RBG_13_68_16]|jgi:hypothetical protein|nr:MAG: hypothetical protein A2Y78_16415 [Acidobacteria bacterium RBG_13_68_16]